MLRAVGGPLVTTVGDNKKGMRDAAVASLQVFICQDIISPVLIIFFGNVR
jgi:hypothetical protein